MTDLVYMFGKMSVGRDADGRDAEGRLFPCAGGNGCCMNSRKSVLDITCDPRDPTGPMGPYDPGAGLLLHARVRRMLTAALFIVAPELPKHPPAEE